MGKQRASISFPDELENLNPADWNPRAKEKANEAGIPPPEEIQKVAKAAGFTSREVPPSPETKQETGRRTYRTGRSEQIALKVRPVDKARFYEICDQQDWVLGFGFQKAIEALDHALQNEAPQETRFKIREADLTDRNLFIRREGRTHRTGRSEQFSMKIRLEDRNKFYDICDQQEWVLGLGFQRAIEALDYILQNEQVGV